MAMLLDPGDPEVRAAPERARVILVPLRAQPFLDRLEAAMTGWPQAAPVVPRVTGETPRA
jgi:hypothetical protein